MSYNIIDAIKDEVELLDEMAKHAEKKERPFRKQFIMR